MNYQNILVETHDHVGLIILNRPDVLNALSDDLMDELGDAVDNFEADDSIGALVVTVNDKAFAAGADIKRMKDSGYMDVYMDVYMGNFIGRNWERISTCRKPVVAAVAGYALGGGCELAMMCDFIIAADSAQFGQPEIKLGVIPGAGGTQRLTRFVGKSKAMEMCLTGRMMNADEAERSGLVSRIVPADDLLEDAMKTAKKIAALSRPSVMMAKTAVNRAYETTLTEGVRFERTIFQSLFATDDKNEGMAAFIEKRKPDWNHR